MTTHKKRATIIWATALIVVLLVIARQMLSETVPVIHYHHNFEFVPHASRAECSMGVSGLLDPDRLTGGMVEQFPYAGLPTIVSLPARDDAFLILSRDRCEDLPAIVWSVLKDKAQLGGVGFFNLTKDDWASVPNDVGPPLWRDHPNFDARYWALWPMMREGDEEAIIAYYAPDISNYYEALVLDMPVSPNQSPSYVYGNLLEAYESLPSSDRRYTIIGDRLDTLHQSMDERDRKFFDEEWRSGAAELACMKRKARFGLIRPDRELTKISPEARQAALQLF